MKARTRKLFTIAIVLAAILSACAPVGGPANPATVTPTPAPTNLPTPGIPTAVVVTVSASPLPPNPATPTVGLPAPDGVDPSTITLDNNNQLITLHEGETFLLKLGEVYVWDIQIDHPEVISRVMNIAVIRGAQGVYSARQAGTATLTAVGDPACRQSKPACAMPSILFTLHIEVKA